MEPIDYASPRASNLTWRRVVLLVLYYMGWSAGLTVAGAFSLVMLNEGGGMSLMPGDVALVLGAAMGAGTGMGIAYASRRTRWPQWTALALGIVATAGFGFMSLHYYLGPRGFLWELAFAIGMLLTAGGFGLALGGAIGLVLTARGRRRVETTLVG